MSLAALIEKMKDARERATQGEEMKDNPEKEPRAFDATMDNNIEDIADALMSYDVDRVWVTPKQVREAAAEIDSLRRTVVKLATRM